MSLKTKTVSLIFGGRGYEHEVSVTGAEYLFSLLDRRALTPVFISPDGVWKIPKDYTVDPHPCMSFRQILDKISDGDTVTVFPYYNGFEGGFVTEDRGIIPCSVAIPLLHGEWGEDGTVQGALESAFIPYVGCRVTAGALCIDKVLTKAVASSLGIKTAPHVTVRSDSEQDVAEAIDTAEKTLGYPMFVKPIRLGSSVGAGSADSPIELAERIRDALKTGGGAMIEKKIDLLCEAECAVYKTKSKELISGVGGIVSLGGFYDYERKYSGGKGSTVLNKIDITHDQSDTVRRFTKLLSDAIGIRHLGRFDFFVTVDGEVIFNEINTFPGFTSGSLWPRLIRDAGLDPKDAVYGMIEDALG